MLVDRLVLADGAGAKPFRENDGIVLHDGESEAGHVPVFPRLLDVRFDLAEPFRVRAVLGDGVVGGKRDEQRSEQERGSDTPPKARSHIVIRQSMFGLRARSMFGSGKHLMSPYTLPPAGYGAPGAGVSGRLNRRTSHSRCPSRKNSRRRSSTSCSSTCCAVWPVAL